MEELRVAAGMSRAQLAIGAGFKEGSTIYDIERKGAMPKLDKAIGLARALNKPLRVVCESIGLDLSGIPLDLPRDQESA